MRLALLLFLLTSPCAMLAQNLKKIDSLLLVVNHKNTPDTTKIITYNDIGIAYASSDVIKAKYYIQKALNLAESIEKPRGMAGAYNCLGIVYYYQKELDSALYYFEKAFLLNQELNHQWGQASALNQMGVIQDLQADYEGAIESYKKASSIFEQLKDTTALASSMGNIATVYSKIGYYLIASEYQFRAIRLSEKMQNEEGMYLGYTRIARFHKVQGNYEIALEYANQALLVAEKLNNPLKKATTFESIGAIHIAFKKYELARDSYAQALLQRQNLPIDQGLVRIKMGFGTIDYETGKYDSALLYLKDAAELVASQGRKNLIPRIKNTMAKCYLALGQFDLASEHAKAALMVAQSIGSPELEKEIYYTLASIAEGAGKMSQSLQYYKRHMAINDSLYNQQKDKQVNELQIQYETDKKDLAINSLRQEKTIAASQRKIYFLIATVVFLIVGVMIVYLLLKGKRSKQLLEKEKEVDRLKSNFFANISHEFRTPLTLILGPLESMLEKDTHQDNQIHLGIMKKSATRLLRLVNEILALSKAESGHLKINAREIEIEKYVKGVASSFQSLANEADIQLDIEVPNKNLMFFSDENHIETICINLISNALKFSKAGGRIQIRLVEIADHAAGNALELQVIDDGIGISKEQVKHVFNRFYSANDQQFEGTGIGLALTKELVEALGGTIQLTSELKKGSMVMVRLPFIAPNRHNEQVTDEATLIKEQEHHQKSILADAQAEPLQAEGEKGESELIVLLIDDNEDVRAYIKTVLSDKYKLMEAINGEEGLIQAKAFVPDLIISDVMMPKMNGYEVCKYLKSNEITSHIPVILLTAKASIDSRIEGLETEADLYMSKPFHPKELLLSIHNLIQSRKVLRERYNREVTLNPTNIVINSKDELFLQLILDVLEQHYSDENFSVEQLSNEVGMSRSQLHRKLQALTNESTSQLIRTFRLKRAMELLKKQHASISEISFLVGFSSYAYFNKSFVKYYGCTPTSIIEGSATEADIV